MRTRAVFVGAMVLAVILPTVARAQLLPEQDLAGARVNIHDSSSGRLPPSNQKLSGMVPDLEMALSGSRVRYREPMSGTLPLVRTSQSGTLVNPHTTKSGTLPDIEVENPLAGKRVNTHHKESGTRVPFKEKMSSQFPTPQDKAP